MPENDKQTDEKQSKGDRRKPVVILSVVAVIPVGISLIILFFSLQQFALEGIFPGRSDCVLRGPFLIRGFLRRGGKRIAGSRARGRGAVCQPAPRSIVRAAMQKSMAFVCPLG